MKDNCSLHLVCIEVQKDLIQDVQNIAKELGISGQDMIFEFDTLQFKRKV